LKEMTNVMAVENNKNNLAQMHSCLAALLPEATNRAIRSYHQFANQDVTHDAKNFTAHHAACKAALAHLDYLTKLAQWVAKQQPTDTQDNHTNDLNMLVQQARLQLLHVQQSYDDNG
jgi:adenosylmethionine-8-amino-7-oxononanoate aminotransferase